METIHIAKKHLRFHRHGHELDVNNNNNFTTKRCLKYFVKYQSIIEAHLTLEINEKQPDSSLDK